MRTFKLTLAYDGTNYAGWQLQPGQPTIQGAVEAALGPITGEPVRTAASGRTDAGVHAIGQVVSFSVETRHSADVFYRALNASLPRDITVIAAEEKHAEFHAIRDTVRKRYRYVIHDGAVMIPFERIYAWHHSQYLDAQAMQQAATTLVGTHDFSSFQSSGSERESTTRTIYELTVERRSNLFAIDRSHSLDHIVIDVEANGFLYNMVRNIVGTLVEIGRGSESQAWIADVLARRDRRTAGPTAPAHGLYLAQVWYDK